MGNIAIIGLSGESIFMKVGNIPSPSVTTHAKEYHVEPGGKGYNQAVAAKKLGANVSYLMKIGNDQYGKVCEDYLINLDIKLVVEYDHEHNTALATILTEDSGENSVIVYPGASSYLNEQSVLLFENAIKDADVLLIQYELPINVIKKAIALAKKYDTQIILNPAPANYDELEIINSVDVVTPNFEECKKIFNLPYAKVEELGELLYRKYEPIIIVTLGNKGVLVVHKNWYKYFNAYNVDAVDTTGAGDIFNAGLAACMADGKPILESIMFSMAASALSVTKPYIMDAIPSKDEVLSFQKLYNLKEK